MISHRFNAALLFLALLAALPAFADEAVLKDGRIIPIVNPQVSGDSLMTEVKIGNGTGQIGYPLSTVASIRLPKPPQLQTATDLLALGQAAQALPLLDPVLAFYGPLKNVPGNWWVPAALLKSTALLDLRRGPEAEPLLTDLSRLAADPDSALLAKVRLAAIAAGRGGPGAAALQVYDAAIDKSSDPATLAETWTNKGDTLLAGKQYEPALLAYLHVPVFFPDRKLLMPRALLGSARAFRGMEDYKHAMDYLNQIETDYPASPDSAAAAAELKEVEGLDQKKP